MLEITVWWVQLSTEMTLHIITPCCWPECLAIVKTGSTSPPTHTSTHCRGCLKTCLRLSLGHNWKLGLVTKDCTFQSVQFLVDRVLHHFNRIWRCTYVRDKRQNGRWKHKFRSLSYVPRIMCAGHMVDSSYRRIWCCDSCSDNRSVFPFYCGSRSTAAALALISAVV